jgi:hypothetical protein
MAEAMARKTVAVYPGSRMAALAPILDALAMLFPVRFLPWDGAVLPFQGLLNLAEDMTVSEQAYRMGLPVLHVADQALRAGTSVRSGRFVGCPILQPFLRGIEFRVKDSIQYRAMERCSDDLIIATAGDDDPLWTERCNGKASLRKLMLELPVLAVGEPVFPQLLHGGWIRWLPLFHFLRELTADIDWKSNGLHACFMFDDPNLHWSSWGFLDYHELAEHARQHHYHASMATVPLDMWFTHSRTAALFREQSEHLSLLVHGIEHSRAELQYLNSAERLLRGLHWSIGKLTEIEQRHRLRISRVMAPPHHGFNIEAANSMLQAGYDAACVGSLSLMRSNPNVRWRPDFGLQCADFFGDGLPIVPRFNFAGQDPVRAALAVFFHQPIVMVGHHQDVAGGLQILADWARWVNTLGPVRWTSLEEIMYSNYLTRMVNGTLFVKLGARKVRLSIPDGVDKVVLVRQWVVADQLEPVCLLRQGNPARLPLTPGPQVEPFAVTPREQLTVHCVVPEKAQPSPRSHSFRMWPIARRLACELRDRFSPLVTKPRAAARTNFPADLGDRAFFTINSGQDASRTSSQNVTFPL